jgi:transcriptional regulator with XRE-family HTH domain
MSQQGGEYQWQSMVDAIREELRRRNWSQAEFAEASGVSTGTISRLLAGENAPSLDTLERLAKALGYDLLSFIALVRGGAGSFDDQALIGAYHRLDAADRELVLDLAKRLVERQRDRGAANFEPQAVQRWQ